MNAIENLQAMINGRLAEIDQLEAEVSIMRQLLQKLGAPKNGAPGGGRKRDEERHAKLLEVLRAPAGMGAGVEEMSRASGYGLSSMQTKIKKMFKAGEVERVSKGRYRLKGV